MASFYDVVNTSNDFKIIDSINVAPGERKENVELTEDQVNIFILTGLQVIPIYNDYVAASGIGNFLLTDGTTNYTLKQKTKGDGTLVSTFYKLDGSIANPNLTSLKISAPSDSSATAVFGSITDTPANSNTGNFSIISFIKYTLASKWDALLAKIPALTSGNRIPVDGSGVTQPISIQGQTGNLAVAGTVTLGAGSATFGTALIGGSLPAGSNNIGSVGLAGSLPTGTNSIGAVTQGGSWSFSLSGTAAVTQSGSWTVGATQSGTWNVNSLGNVASGATDSGNPVKVGGVYNPTLPTFSAGQRGDLQVDSQGRLLITGTLAGVASAVPDGVLPSPTGYSSTSVNTLFSLDVTGYNSASVQISTIATGSTLITEVSNDNVNWFQKAGTFSSSTGTITDAATFFSPIIVEFSLKEKYFRLRQTTYTSGTTTVIPVLKIGEVNPRSTLSYIGGSANPSGAADPSNAIKIGGVYNSSLPTYSTGQKVELQTDVNGRLLTSIGVPLPSGTNTIGSIASITNALPSGGNTIGSVTQSGTWNVASITNSLPSGTNNIGVVTPAMSGSGNLNAVTSTTANSFTAFASQACKQLTITNNTGQKIEVQQGGTGTTIVVFDQSYYTFYGITNTNQLGVRRVDLATTAVTVQARWES